SGISILSFAARALSIGFERRRSIYLIQARLVPVGSRWTPGDRGERTKPDERQQAKCSAAWAERGAAAAAGEAQGASENRSKHPRSDRRSIGRDNRRGRRAGYSCDVPPRFKRLPSGNSMSRAFARNEPSLAWKPSTLTLVPA